MLKEIKKELVKFLSILKSENFDVTELSEDAVKVSERKVGGKVELIGTDGNLSDAPDGDYKVGDFSFTVKAGVIDSIEGEDNPAEEDKPAEEKLADEPVAEDAPVEDNSVKEAITALQTETASIKQDIESIKAMLAEFAGKSDVEDFKSEVVKLNQTIEKLAKIPAEFSKTNNSNIVKDKQEDKINQFLKVFNK